MSAGFGAEPNIGEIVEHLRSRYYGKYRGTVIDVDAATMRVKASVPAIGPIDLGWATACVPYAGPNVGFTMLPEVGSGVWIEFEGGDVSYPIWVGGYWRAGEIPAAAADQKAIFTNAGTFTMNDGAGSLTLEDASGNKLVVDGSGVLAQGTGGKVAVGATVSVNDGSLEVS